MRRTDSILRPLLTVAFLYLFPLGATWNGVLLPMTKFITLGLMALVFVVWQVARWRGRWTWHHTSLDLMFPLWGLAFAAALLVNDESWRRTFIGLWYVGVYIGVWYLLHDLIANRALKREVLVDAMLAAALIVVAFGYVQIAGEDYDLSRLDFPRPGSVIGNPNSLGTFLLVMMALSLSRLLAVRALLARLALILYNLLVIILLIATFSRGAWIGAVAVIGTLALLWLDSRRLRSMARLQVWITRHRRGTIMVGLTAAVALLVMAAVVIQSLSISGRGVGLRTEIWEDAATLFTEQPLTGHGLFTFGQAYLSVESQPPSQPHSHAHNALLHIGAELGLIGLVVLGITLVVLARSVWINWRAVEARQRWMLGGAIAAVAGFGTHHLLDMTAMMPLIALLGILVLVIATVPATPKPLQTRWRRMGHPWGVAGLWLVLLASGLWGAASYASYESAMRAPFGDNGDGDYRAAAETMQSTIDADPNLALYHAQQGMLYSLAADNGDTDALTAAISAYQRFTELEPDNAVGWANLAALQWANNERDAAIQAMRNAAEIAPEAWQLWLIAGTYAEINGDTELAREAYTEALIPGTYLHPVWTTYDVAGEVYAEGVLAGIDTLTLAVVAGLIDPAMPPEDFFASIDYEVRDNIPHRVLAALVALRQGDPDTAASLLDEATERITSDDHRAWVQVGRAYYLRAIGDEAGATQSYTRALNLLARDIIDEDLRYGSNIANFQFLRFTLPRQFVPQLDYDPVSPVLRALIDGFAAGAFSE